MKIRDGFVVRKIADTIVAVPTGDLINDINKIINLNSTGKFMWELLENDISKEELIEKVVEKYKIDEEIAKRDVEKFLNNLREEKILEE